MTPGDEIFGDSFHYLQSSDFEETVMGPRDILGLDKPCEVF